MVATPLLPPADTNVRGFCQGLGGLPVPRLYVVRQTGCVFPRQRAIEFGEEGRGLLRVSVEVVLYAEWSLAPTLFIWGAWGLGRRG